MESQLLCCIPLICCCHIPALNLLLNLKKRTKSRHTTPAAYQNTRCWCKPDDARNKESHSQPPQRFCHRQSRPNTPEIHTASRFFTHT